MKCPKCKKEIEWLNFSADVIQGGRLSIDERGDTDWDTRDYGDWNNLELFCPECDELLFTSEEEAIKFLKKPKEIQEVIK